MISKRFFSIREKFKLTQKDMAEKLHVQKSVISEIESGKRDVSKNVILELIKNFKISANWLLTGEGEMFQGQEVVVGGGVRVPLLRQSVSCGPGQEWNEGDFVEEYVEIMNAFPSMVNAKIYAFRVRGTSMVGAGIYDGDIVLFDGSGRVGGDDVYVFAYDGSVFCKLLKFGDFERTIKIYSLHSSVIGEAELLKELRGDNTYDMERFHLFGRVLAWMHENRLMWR